jgi:xylulokinase
MSCFLGIDIGTSGVKSVIIDDHDGVQAESLAPLTIQRPRPLWCEQEPDAWWLAVAATLDDLSARHPVEMASTSAIGLSGQMLGVALLDERQRAIRPALLWNDGRAGEECVELEGCIVDFPGVTGSRPMPGFSAPKLRWLSKHEPAALAQARSILLPKDYVRLKLTGEAITDWADMSASLLVDIRQKSYAPEILNACGIDRSQLPNIVASCGIGGVLRPELAARWKLRAGIPVAGGAGDNMAGAVGAGVATSGDAVISLGTSGVYFVVNDTFLPAYDKGMHTHLHAIDGLFAQHGVILSATAALSWIAEVTGGGDIGALVRSIEADPLPIDETPIFTPYLGGERTPHNDPGLTASFLRMTFSTSRRHLIQAVMEGVALAFKDCHQALISSGAAIDHVALIGGGSRSRFWAELIASSIGLPLSAPKTGVIGPALGAARLARSAIGGPLIATEGVAHSYQAEPCPAMAEALLRKGRLFSHPALR